MTKPLSMDIRERAMARLDEGETVRRIAEALSVAPSSVVKWSERRRETGSVAPGKIGGHVLPKIRGADADWLRARMFEDSGRSGLRLDGREALQNLMAEVRSGHADFKAILVYDVSRWGRFQDADEGAYHEHVCSRAGSASSSNTT